MLRYWLFLNQYSFSPSHDTYAKLVKCLHAEKTHGYEVLRMASVLTRTIVLNKFHFGALCTVGCTVVLF